MRFKYTYLLQLEYVDEIYVRKGDTFSIELAKKINGTNDLSNLANYIKDKFNLVFVVIKGYTLMRTRRVSGKSNGVTSRK